MWRHRALIAALAVAACSPSSDGRNEVDIGNAARAAQAYGDRADDVPAATPAAEPTDVDTAAPAPSASPTREVVAETPFTPDSAQGAAGVVQRYYALIGEGKYGAAWQLWDRDGAASGMERSAFVASFAKYRDYRAEVGAPGAIDAGAGQRYVTVPVKVSGTLKTGAPFAMEGPITLHRAGDIDGATAAQKSWRLYTSGVRPRPVAAGQGGPTKVAARYRCIDGSRFRALFDNVRDTATLTLAGRTVTLAEQQPASGIWYAGDGYDLRGKGDAATLTGPDGPPLACTAGR